MDDNLVLVLVPLPPRLLPDNPDTGAHAWPGLGRLLAHDELETRHGPEAAFEGLTGGYQVAHGEVVHGLGHDDVVVGRTLEEGRLGEVEEDGVGVEATHGLDDLGRPPLNLVEGRIIWVGHLWQCVLPGAVGVFAKLRYFGCVMQGKGNGSLVL